MWFLSQLFSLLFSQIFKLVFFILSATAKYPLGHDGVGYFANPNATYILQ